MAWALHKDDAGNLMDSVVLHYRKDGKVSREQWFSRKETLRLDEHNRDSGLLSRVWDVNWDYDMKRKTSRSVSYSEWNSLTDTITSYFEDMALTRCTLIVWNNGDSALLVSERGRLIGITRNDKNRLHTQVDFMYDGDDRLFKIHHVTEGGDRKYITDHEYEYSGDTVQVITEYLGEQRGGDSITRTKLRVVTLSLDGNGRTTRRQSESQFETESLQWHYRNDGLLSHLDAYWTSSSISRLGVGGYTFYYIKWD